MEIVLIIFISLFDMKKLFGHGWVHYLGGVGEV